MEYFLLDFKASRQGSTINSTVDISAFNKTTLLFGFSNTEIAADEVEDPTELP